MLMPVQVGLGFIYRYSTEVHAHATRRSIVHTYICAFMRSARVHAMRAEEAPHVHAHAKAPHREVQKYRNAHAQNRYRSIVQRACAAEGRAMLIEC